ncbi:MAG: DNA-3-methyladenine glycosylase 2 family protein [Pseudomonadota bacterium]
MATRARSSTNSNSKDDRHAGGVDVFGDTSAPCAALARRDVGLNQALSHITAPHIRRRPGGFEGLFRIIVEQQVSVPAAQAILARCHAVMAPVCPEAAMQLGEDGLRACGLSRPKARYAIGLASAVKQSDVDLDALARADNDTADAALQRIKGVGPWTAAIYLLFCEGRVDIWPPRDVALLGAYRHACAQGPGRSREISQLALDARAARWAPHRGLAAHILWTYYAKIRGRTPI